MEIYAKRIKGNDLEEISYELVTFPSGEFMPRINWDESVVSCNDGGIMIMQDLRTPDDIMLVAMVVNAIRNIYKTKYRTPAITLVAPYIMGARQDRVCGKGEPLSAKVVADLINSLELANVVTTEPHSDVLPALINNCIVEYTYDIIIESIVSKTLTNTSLSGINVVAPDAGASKRAFKFMKYLREKTDHKVKFIQGEKHRDPESGKLSGFSCGDNSFKEDELVIVVDDVCANGGTFLGLAEALFDSGVNKSNLVLAVCHVDNFDKLKNVAKTYGGGVFVTTETENPPTNIFVCNV